MKKNIFLLIFLALASCSNNKTLIRLNHCISPPEENKKLVYTRIKVPENIMGKAHYATLVNLTTREQYFLELDNNGYGIIPNVKDGKWTIGTIEGTVKKVSFDVERWFSIECKDSKILALAFELKRSSPTNFCYTIDWGTRKNDYLYLKKHYNIRAWERYFLEEIEQSKSNN